MRASQSVNYQNMSGYRLRVPTNSLDNGLLLCQVINDGYIGRGNPAPTNTSTHHLSVDRALLHSDDSASCEGLTEHISCADVDNMRPFGSVRGEFRLPDVR